ncbi:hypothetical protein AB3S75_002310 [Citrus x aurantiifolia]
MADYNNRGEFLLEALNVRVVGQGQSIIVFSHGFGSDQSVWSRVIPSFTCAYRVISFDLMCSGSCDPTNYDFQRYATLDGYVDDLLSFLDALEIDRCAFVGHSVSAMIGLLAAIHRPNLFSRLILIGGSPRFTNDGNYIGGIDPAHMEEVFRRMESNYESWVAGFVPMALGADVPDMALQEFSRTLFSMRPDIALHVARTAFAADLRHVLGLVRVPVCIIQSSVDLSVPPAVAEYMRRHLGGPTVLEFLPTHGHLPHVSSPAPVANAIQQLLRRRI